MKKKIKIIAIVIFLINSSQSFACKFDSDSSWHWDKEKLTLNTKEIFLAEVIDTKPTSTGSYSKDTIYQFKILSYLKGSSKKKDFSIIGEKPLEADKYQSVSYGKDCSVLVAFQKNKIYLIFKDSFNPAGYSEVKLDQWYYQTLKMVTDNKAI